MLICGAPDERHQWIEERTIGSRAQADAIARAAVYWAADILQKDRDRAQNEPAPTSLRYAQDGELFRQRAFAHHDERRPTRRRAHIELSIIDQHQHRTAQRLRLGDTGCFL